MMKSWLAIGSIGMALMACMDSSSSAVSTDMIHIPATASGNAPRASDLPGIVFQDTLVDLGSMVEGAQKGVLFTFTNTGKAPKHPIGAGKSGQIHVNFDSRDRQGTNKKTIFVVANTIPSVTELTLLADVIGPTTP
jgi:hypothetical protein